MHPSSAPGLRWLVVAPLAEPPSGRTLPLADALDQLGLVARVDLGPALGAAGPLPVDLAFPRLSAFNLAGVLTAAPLAALAALSQRLAGPPSKCPSPPELLAAVATIAGEGRLHAELAALFAEPAAPAPNNNSTNNNSADLVAELLAGPTLAAPAATPRPAAIVEAFVRAGRPQSPAPTRASALRAARDRLDLALAAAARAALDDPAVDAREALWRGLKLLHAQNPGKPDPKVSLLDSDLAGLGAVLDALADDEPMERPDAIFLAAPITELADLPALVGQAAAILVPLVVSLAPTTLAHPDLLALADEAAVLPAAWTELRADDDSRWLAAAANPVALTSEAAGATRRVVFGAPALGLAALLSASHRDTGGLASLARPGVVRAPANWEPTTGPEQGTSIPTERFAALRTQARLAAHGLVTLGSPRGGDSLVVAACPTVHAGADAVSLPAQIFTGRIVRFAFWARDQVPAGSTAAELEALFAEAARVFLFPGLAPEAAALRVSCDRARNDVTISAFVHPALAGARLEIQFALPLTKALS